MIKEPNKRSTNLKSSLFRTSPNPENPICKELFDDIPNEKQRLLQLKTNIMCKTRIFGCSGANLLHSHFM